MKTRFQLRSGASRTRQIARVFQTALAATLAWSGMLGCGGKSTTEKFTVVESRIEPCRLQCQTHQNPECPYNDHFASMTLDQCIQECASSNPLFAAAFQPAADSSGDRCVEEFVAWNECYATLSCEERTSAFAEAASLGIDPPCAEEQVAMGQCAREEENK